jgi:guanylate kinase
MLYVISAPSGAGKTTIIKEIFKNLPEMKFSVSATTRKIRNGEREGKDYYFVSRDAFEIMIKNNEFIEWEKVHGELYGTLKRELQKGADNPADMIFDVDVKGALSIKKLLPEAVTIFIDAPKNEIIERLRNRRTESEEQLNKRIKRMESELKLKDGFDHVVDNKSRPGGLQRAVNEILNIIKQSKPVYDTGEENK